MSERKKERKFASNAAKKKPDRGPTKKKSDGGVPIFAGKRGELSRGKKKERGHYWKKRKSPGRLDVSFLSRKEGNHSRKREKKRGKRSAQTNRRRSD